MERTNSAAVARLKPKALTNSAEQRLKAYALAGAAVALSPIVAATPADAQIVYTPTDIVLTHGNLSVDLNNDGIVDFTLGDKLKRDRFNQGRSYIASRFVTVSGGAGASVVEDDRGWPAPMNEGDLVSSQRKFKDANGKPLNMAHLHRVVCTSSCGFQTFSGPWRSVQDRYLGLKFEINGDIYYGWARLTTKIDGKKLREVVKLTGYAYESTPNTAIRAGRKSLDQSETTVAPENGLPPKSQSLGALARGSAK